jgi:hypothetical protein
MPEPIHHMRADHSPTRLPNAASRSNLLGGRKMNPFRDRSRRLMVSYAEHERRSSIRLIE